MLRRVVAGQCCFLDAGDGPQLARAVGAPVLDIKAIAVRLAPCLLMEMIRKTSPTNLVYRVLWIDPRLHHSSRAFAWLPGTRGRLKPMIG